MNHHDFAVLEDQITIGKGRSSLRERTGEAGDHLAAGRESRLTASERLLALTRHGRSVATGWVVGQGKES